MLKEAHEKIKASSEKMKKKISEEKKVNWEKVGDDVFTKVIIFGLFAVYCFTIVPLWILSVVGVAFYDFVLDLLRREKEVENIPPKE